MSHGLAPDPVLSSEEIPLKVFNPDWSPSTRTGVSGFLSRGIAHRGSLLFSFRPVLMKNLPSCAFLKLKVLLLFPVLWTNGMSHVSEVFKVPVLPRFGEVG